MIPVVKEVGLAAFNGLAIASIMHTDPTRNSKKRIFWNFSAISYSKVFVDSLIFPPNNLAMKRVIPIFIPNVCHKLINVSIFKN